MKNFTTYLVIALVLALSGNIAAYDFLTSRGTSLGQATLLTHPSPSEMINLPSGRLELGEWRFETALNRAFDLKDFDQFMIAGAGRKGMFSLAGGFSQFGKSDLYTEQIAKLTIAAHFDSLTVAAGGSYLLIGFGGNYDDLSAATLHISSSFQRNWLTAAVGIDNLTSPSLNDGSPRTDPLYTAELEYRGSRPISLIARVQAQRQERPRFSLGQHVSLGNNAALMLGVVTAPFQFGGGIEFAFKGGQLIYGVSAHPVLGLSQTVAISFGSWTPKKNRGAGEFK